MTRENFASTMLKLFSCLCFALAGSQCNRKTNFQAQPLPDSGNVTQADGPTMRPIRQEFKVADIGRESVTVSKESNTITHQFQQVVDNPKVSAYTQVNRTPVEESFTQGTDGDNSTENFSLQLAGKLDLLLVIDNSQSMEPYQNLLAPRLQDLLTSVSNTDWQIAIVTTDNSCLADLINSADYALDPAQTATRFANAVNAGTFGHPLERGIEMAIKGLHGECGTGDQPWIRSESSKAVLVVSDEANCGSASNESCTDRHYTPQDFLDLTPTGTKFFGIFQDRNSCTYNYEKDLDEYYNLVALTSGLWSPICQASYESTLKSISANINSTLRKEVTLEHTPDGASFHVSVDQMDLQPGDYQIQGNLVTITKMLPGDASSIAIQYSYGAVPKFDQVQLAQSPAAGSFKIWVDQHPLKKNEFTYDENSGILQFHSMPPDDASIRVHYRLDNLILKDEFDFPEQALPQSVQVKVNGQKGAHAYQVMGHKIKFDQPPDDGAGIEIVYNEEDDYQVRYPLPDLGDMEVDSIEVVDPDLAVDVPHTIENQEIVFSREDVHSKRNVEVLFISPQRMPSVVHLTHEPLENSMEISTDSDDNSCADHYQLLDQEIDISCELETNAINEIKVSYEHLIDYRNAFEPDGFILPGSQWSIWVDGEKIEDFSIDEGLVRIPDSLLSLDSVVLIEVLPPKRSRSTSP